ncbi:phage baseplate assembly protein V [uncultured Clostridium sp.]|uniref:phage baseplate assembly protein V n=1 Tax=uncultured Clostridium sp. TaxID=59620 RepID=UPI0025E88688|nr:phage baseplate assembly protein V [uncultured Clostridium sp.]
MGNGYVYTKGDIIVEPKFFEEILDLKIESEVNEHSKLYVTGVVSEEYELSDKLVEYAGIDSTIKISVKNDKEDVTDLFHGLVANIGIECINNVKTLKIEALGYTFKLDIEKRSRSFQGNWMTYRRIFEVINCDIGNVSMIDYTTADRKINTMLVQYNETDWEFIKRIASHFNVPIVPNCKFNGVKYSVGRGEGGSLYSLDEFNYKVNKSLKDYRIQSSRTSFGLNDVDLISYEIESNLFLDLYAVVNFKNRCLYVSKSETVINKDLIYTRYTLKEEKGMLVNKKWNENIVGASIEGKVVGVEQDKVRVALAVNAYSEDYSFTEWVPYATVFSSPDGTGWYCMPEIGDAVRMYFPDSNEANGYVISSVDLKSSNSAKRIDPSAKSFSTKYGKSIVMRPGAIEIISSGNSMTLSDKGGISINSDKNISMSASSVNISGGSVLINGEGGVTLSQAGAKITIKNDIVMSGGKINTQ